MNGLLEIVAGQTRAGDGNDLRSGPQPFVKLIAEYDGAAADADENYVEAERDPGPEVNLEKRLAKPEAVRTPQRSVPERHGVFNNIAGSAGNGRLVDNRGFPHECGNGLHAADAA